MDIHSTQINLVLAWLWVVLGFASGSVAGFNFNFFREDWMGGYSSLKRRLYRLGHISFFGLGFVNLMFYFTAQRLTRSGPLLDIASWGFIVGAITMPTFCFLMAHYPKLKNLFYVPVISLVIAGLLTFWVVAGL